MSVKSVTKVHNEKWTRDAAGVKGTVNYRVEFTSFDNTGADCFDATDPTTSLDVPTSGDTVTATVDGSSVTCSLDTVEPQQIDKLTYIVACNYSSKPSGTTTIDSPNAHGNWDLDFSFRQVPIEVETAKDNNGDPIVNSAGEPYKGVKVTMYDGEYTISFKTLDPASHISAIDAVIGCVNSGSCTFTINGVTRTFAALTLRLTDAEYSTKKDGENLVWNFTLKLQYHEDTWVTSLVDEGTYYKDGSGNRIEAPTGGNVLLNGTGGQNPDGDDPLFNDFALVFAASFTTLFGGL